MSDSRDEIRALLDPAQTERLTDGSLLQHVSVVISDDGWRDPQPQLPAAVCTLRPRDARELAFELLALAEQAERLAARR